MYYSRGLARHFQLLSTTWPRRERPAYIGLFHNMPVLLGGGVLPQRAQLGVLREHERSVIVLAFNGAHDDDLAGQLLYVGRFRAQSLPVVVGPREEIEAAAGPQVMAQLDAGKAWCPPEA